MFSSSKNCHIFSKRLRNFPGCRNFPEICSQKLKFVVTSGNNFGGLYYSLFEHQYDILSIRYELIPHSKMANVCIAKHLTRQDELGLLWNSLGQMWPWGLIEKARMQTVREKMN